MRAPIQLGILACIASCQAVFGVDELPPNEAAIDAAMIDAAIDADLTIDTDNDGQPDVDDNCPGVANPMQENTDGDPLGNVCDNCPLDDNDQHDEDADGIGDSCDNCPHVANPTQENTDVDGLGEACDFDNTAHDCLAFFDSFHAAAPIGWTNARGTWVIMNDTLVLTDVVGHGILLAPGTYDAPLVATTATITGGAPTGGNIGLWAAVTVNNNPLPVGMIGEIFDPVPNQPTFGVATIDGNQASSFPVPYGPLSTMDQFAPDSRVSMYLEIRGAPNYAFSATHVATNGNVGTGQHAGAGAPAQPASGRTGVRLNGLTARFDSFIVVTRQPTCPARTIQ